MLTNVSLTFNTLKVLAMSDEISRFFEVSLTPTRLGVAARGTGGPKYQALPPDGVPEHPFRT